MPSVHAACACFAVYQAVASYVKRARPRTDDAEGGQGEPAAHAHRERRREQAHAAAARGGVRGTGGFGRGADGDVQNEMYMRTVVPWLLQGNAKCSRAGGPTHAAGFGVTP
jgi:hypothetical protein